VCPIGNPIIHSTNIGFGTPPSAVLREVPPCANLAFRKPVSEANGVGNNPDAIPPVRSAKGVKGEAMPLRIIPDLREAAEHFVQSARAKDGGVFEDDEGWSRFLDDAGELAPHGGLLSVKSPHPPCEADILTGESPCDDINGTDAVSNKSGCCEFSHVVIARHLRPVFCQHPPAKWVDLTEGRGLVASPLKADRKSADAAEQIEDGERAHFTVSSACGMRARAWRMASAYS
jgi:hypothetical protein